MVARPRAERVCRLCVAAGNNGAPVEDEKHVALECPAHQQLRDSFPALPFNQGMLALMTHPDQKMLAEYLFKLRSAYEHAHDACVDGLECDVCGSADNGRDVLLCDGRCCRGYHRQCLNPVPAMPAMNAVWFCPDCAARLHA